MRISIVHLQVLVLLAAGSFCTVGAAFGDRAHEPLRASIQPDFPTAPGITAPNQADNPASPGITGLIQADYPGVTNPDSVTLVEMRNVHFRIDSRLALNIRQLEGRMQPLPGHDVIDFGDSESFYIGLEYAEIGMTMGNLTYLLQNYVFGYDGSPLIIESVGTEGSQLRQTGTLHKVVDIPFEMTAEVTATSDGLIRLHPTSMVICDIPGEGLMEALGIQLEDLLDLSGAQGVTVDGNDLLMDPEQLMPPPAIRGRLEHVRIEGDELVQVFGRPADAPVIESPSEPNARNYMFYSGGTLHFGKLYMVEADLQIIDDDPSDPFDFFLQEYMAQLVAGYSVTLPDGGLAAFFPDYDDIENEVALQE